MKIQKTPKASIRMLKPLGKYQAGQLIHTMSRHNARLLVATRFAEWIESTVEAPVPEPVAEETPVRRRRAYKRRDMQAEHTTDVQTPE